MNMKRLLLVLLLTLAGLSGVHAISFSAWQAAHFSAAELADPALSGEAANPAGDGLSNWLKFAFDLDPHAACSEGGPAAQMLGGALALNFFHRMDGADLFYALEASPDLTHWSLRNAFQPSAILPAAGAAAQWTVADPYQWPAGVSKFLRLRVVGGDPGMLFLDPPANLTARTVKSPFGLELRWSDRSNAEIGYRVERRRLTDGVWDLFAITGQDTMSYFDLTVQSGVAYAYRVRAMFPYGVFSGWSESGTVIPGGGGGSGGGGGGGGGNPDPDPDTDGDTFKDSVDAYPHDKRRSRDLPVMSYVALDVSSAVTTLPILAVALDEQNTVAFAYEDATKLYAAVTRDGATVGTPLAVTKEHTITYDLQVTDNTDPNNPTKRTVSETATGKFSLLSYGQSFVNSAGHLTGHIIYTAPGSETTPGGTFRRVFIATSSTPVEIYPPLPSNPPDYFRPGLEGGTFAWASFLGNTDTSAGSFYNSESFVASGAAAQWFAHSSPNLPGATDGSLDLGPSSFNGTAAGYKTSYPSYATTTLLWPSQTPLGTLWPRAVNDSGLVLGVQPSLLPGSDDVVLSSPAGKLADTLPAVYKQQIRLPKADFACLNNQGDMVIGGAEVLEGPEDTPVWGVHTLLWRKATSELFIIQLPEGVSAVQQINKSGCFSAIAGSPILDAQGDPVLDANGNPTYRQFAALVVPVEFVTKGPNGEFLPQAVTWNSVVPPQIEVTAASATYAANALTVSVTGKVTDATSDCTPTPGKQVATLFLTGAPAEVQVTLNNTATPVATDPWRPYKYEATFTRNLTIPITGPGNYAVRLRTSENAGGLAGNQEVNIHVQASDLTQAVQLQLPASFSATQADTITMTMGVAPATETVTLTETGDATHIFTGQRGSSTVTLAFAQTPALTAAADNLSATLTKSLSGQTVSSIPLSFVETGATTNAFNVQPPTNPSYDVTTSSGGSSDPGNFYPTIVRFPAGIGQSLITAGYKIAIMEHDWSLKLKTYQGQEYAYVVDDNDKPVVFNPSLYAHTDIQTKKLINGKFPLTIKGPNGEKLWGKDEMLTVASGLLIYGTTGATAKDYLKSKLTHLAEPIHPRVQGRAEGAYLYSPEKGQDLGHLGNDIETEIVWRYVNTKDTVVIFNSYQEMQNDIAYRKEICRLANTKVDPGFGNDNRANPTKWKSGDLTGVQFGPVVGQNGKRTWKDSLDDVFAGGVVGGSPLYQIGCQNTVSCLHLLAFVNLFGEPILEKRIGETRDEVVDPKFLANYTTVTWGFPSANKISRDDDYRQSWIPGDLGYIDNTSIPNSDPANTGEHVLYVGGSFDLDYAHFKDNAQFFGHRFSATLVNGQLFPLREIMSLAAWILKIDGLSENTPDDAKLDPYQRVLRQPFTK